VKSVFELTSVCVVKLISFVEPPLTSSLSPARGSRSSIASVPAGSLSFCSGGSGRGSCFVPSTVVHSHPRVDVAYVPVRDAEPAVVSLAWRTGGVNSATAAFIETARDAARTAPGV
jgi:hypothetical protein